MKPELNFFFWKKFIMFNIVISAIAGFFAYICGSDLQEIGVLGAIGWILVSGYFFLCELIEQYIQKEKQ